MLLHLLEVDRGIECRGAPNRVTEQEDTAVLPKPLLAAPAELHDLLIAAVLRRRSLRLACDGTAIESHTLVQRHGKAHRAEHVAEHRGGAGWLVFGFVAGDGPNAPGIALRAGPPGRRLLMHDAVIAVGDFAGAAAGDAVVVERDDSAAAMLQQEAHVPRLVLQNLPRATQDDRRRPRLHLRQVLALSAALEEEGLQESPARVPRQQHLPAAERLRLQRLSRIFEHLGLHGL
mmetsp:Transcript_6982/g.26884  ORF Transcript_6982/g.26884 Transcript_6982/m.26884 type:complete len:232 (+) Transcript_6982:629-1324(+)|eukprot:scaffold13_cov241-Pinguiococcus_pyrenoidosus.AAC.30